MQKCFCVLVPYIWNLKIKYLWHQHHSTHWSCFELLLSMVHIEWRCVFDWKNKSACSSYVNTGEKKVQKCEIFAHTHEKCFPSPSRRIVCQFNLHLTLYFRNITILHELLQCISKHTTLFDQTNLFRDTVWATLQWKSRKTD